MTSQKFPSTQIHKRQTNPPSPVLLWWIIHAVLGPLPQLRPGYFHDNELLYLCRNQSRLKANGLLLYDWRCWVIFCALGWYPPPTPTLPLTTQPPTPTKPNLCSHPGALSQDGLDPGFPDTLSDDLISGYRCIIVLQHQIWSSLSRIAMTW